MAPDFEAFWRSTLSEYIDVNASPLLVEHPTPMKNVRVKDVTVSGFNGDPIKGWFLESNSAEDVTPCIIMYDGYGGGRGLPHVAVLGKCWLSRFSDGHSWARWRISPK
jgi:cephalosporin-C deacetylase